MRVYKGIILFVWVFVFFVYVIVFGLNVFYGEKKEVLILFKDCLWIVEVVWFWYKIEYLGKFKVNGRESVKFVLVLYCFFREILDVYI